MSREFHRNALPEGFELHEYRIDSILGHGGFGITYLAKDTHLDQWVALKEYLPNDIAVREGLSTVYAKSNTDQEAFEWGLQRFILEARALAQFQHPHIVRVMRFFEANHTAYMVMEYLEGESLSARLKRGPLPEKELLETLLPLLEGLAEVHALGFLHRDIKPANIHLRKDGSPVLLDFGAARQALGQRSTSLTSIVTPGYAPFEQYDSKSAQGPWTDIYALGAVMYYAATGRVPSEVVGRLKRDDMPRAVELAAGQYRRELLRAIDWALALDEEARPQSVAEWREALLAPPLARQPQARPKPSQPLDGWYRYFLWSLAVLVIAVPVGYLGYRELQNPGTLRAFSLGQPAAPVTEAEVRTVIGSYFAAVEQADIPQLLKLYADSVEYYHWGQTKKSVIQEDKLDYFTRWPQVKYALAGPIETGAVRWSNETRVNFEINFSTHNPTPQDSTHAITVTGKARHEWRLRRESTGIKIVAEQQKVYSRLRDYAQ